MEKYEAYLEKHQDLMSRLSDSDKEAYIEEFEDRDAYLQNFKKTIENFFTSKKKTESVHSQSKKSVPSRTTRSQKTHSSVLSHISSKKLAEEQKKAELEAQMNALKKKKEIELAKVQLQLEEEELKLSTSIAVAEAKTKVLDKYEQIEYEKSDSSTFTTANTTASPIYQKKDMNQTFTVDVHPKQNLNQTFSINPRDLNPKAPVFEPKQPKVYVQNPPNYDINNNSVAVDAIVRNLKKPNSDIKKFGGDPLEFRKFVRQFKAKVIDNCDSEGEKMNYLEQFTFGEAQRVVQGYSYLPDEFAFSTAMKHLEERYGDSEVMANSFIKKALDWPSIKAGDFKALDQFSLFLIECKNAADSIEAMSILEYSENIKRLMCKLPFHLHDRWRSLVLRIKANGQSVRFDNFVKFVEEESKKVNDLTYGSAALQGHPSQKNKRDMYNQKKTVQASTFATDVALECSFCKQAHKLENCKSIVKLDHQQKLNHLKSLALCFGCLKKGHMTKKCTNRLTCTVCNKKHPTILHFNNENKGTKVESTKETVISPAVSNSGTHVVSQLGAGNSCAMAIIPVKVKLRDKPKVIETYAFFDPGSTVSFCTESLMKQLGGNGKHKRISLDTMGNPLVMNTCMLDGLQVCDMEMNNTVDLPTMFTKDKMPVSKAHIPTNAEISKWPHLSNIHLSEIDSTIDLLIGSNVPDAYTPFEVAIGETGSPHATYTRLGWIVWNVLRQGDISETYLVVNKAEIKAVSDILENDKLEKLVQKSINFDFPEKLINDKREASVEDKCFMKIVSESIVLEDGHFRVDLPLKNKHVKFPNNESQCLQRLKGIRNKMMQNDKFREDYISFMNKILEKGYAEKVPTSEINQDNNRVWYIPHHGVYHPMKPNKIRVVFDCTATYMGISLNAELLQGPDLANNLLGVLMRFRSELIPVQGDIESMFYQVKVPQEDRNLLRFLWWPKGDLDAKPEVYRMTVHLFGATSSPSVCNFALKQTAQVFGGHYSKEVSNTIERNMYVDDCLASSESVGKAISLIKDVKSLCKQGGFNLTKWISSNAEVVHSIPENDRAKEITQLDLDTDSSVERALGVFWFISSDTLSFCINVKQHPATKRGILATVSSVYDPLGIVSPFVLLGRLILQNLCKQGVGWDDEINETDHKRWNKWLHEMSELETIKLVRCYKPQDFGQIVSVQLHCFADASDNGIGIVFYLRFVDDQDNVHCSFVMGKSRVAPLKTITVPRMELTAASRAVRLSKVIIEELDTSVDKVFFWTDSMSVLRYIANRKTRFHTFVANRLALIHEATEIDQWKYVNTKINPSDLASRGMTVTKFKQNPQWLNGPDFLWQSSDTWSTGDNSYEDLHIPHDDPEVIRKSRMLCTTTVESNLCDGMEHLISYFSSWTKLVKAAMRIIQVKEKLMVKCKISTKDGNLQSETPVIDTFCKAKSDIISYVQRQHFQDEIQALQDINGSKNYVKQTSKLVNLKPFIDAEGILRVGGRLERSDMPYSVKHPIILPKNSTISRLIIEEIHRSIGHLGKNSVLSALRQNYWIIGANSIIKSLISKCVICKKYQGGCEKQQMANLPLERVTADDPPFSRVGIDFFGPFEVKQGRSTVKRYGVIFTCLTIRAIHLELAFSLDTDSCINAIRRFIARRGTPKFIRSDNGTNFISANRELKDEIQRWNLDQIQDFMLQRQIEWVFNPPSASHFGGVWERLIRSVRKVLYSIMCEQHIRLSDEGLMTLFCEVEGILNNRPITEMSNDVNDLEVLTPNHLLLLRQGDSFPPGLFHKSDNYVRRRWRQIQYLADLFWSRWRKEFLPLLQKTPKWTKLERNVQEGDIVLISDNTPRNSWSMGRIQEVIKDKDSVVRVAKVKTATSILTRPISKLCLLVESDI